MPVYSEVVINNKNLWTHSKMMCFKLITLCVCFALVSVVSCFEDGARIEVDGDVNVVKDGGSSSSKTQQRYARTTKYTIEELQSTNFPLKYSGDLDLDPCKAGSFMGDIAIPNVSYDQTWDADRLNKSLQQEVERLKQEVLLEGLQVEEEGLTDIIRKRTKQPPPEADDKSNSYNDPSFGIKDYIDPKSITFTNDKSNQKLNRHYVVNVDKSNTNTESNNVNMSNESSSSSISSTTQQPTTGQPSTTPAAEQPKIIESLEQEGILIVNISTSNIITSDTIFSITKPRVEKTRVKEVDQEEKKGKIQSNSREITGDGNGNIHKAKENGGRLAEGERGSTERNTLGGSSTEAGQVRTTKEVSENTKNKHRRRRHGNRRRRPSNEGNSDTSASHSSKEKQYDEDIPKSRRHSLRHGSRVSPYYSRLLKLQAELNMEDDADQQKKPISKMMTYNGSIALEKKSKNAFRDDIEEEKWEPTFKKLDIPIHEFEERFEPSPKEKMQEQIKEDFNNNTISSIVLPPILTPNETEQNQTVVKNLLDVYGNVSWSENWNSTEEPKIHDHDHEEAHHRVSRAATGRKERIWEHGVIPYEIDGNFSGAHKALFKQAMRHWENFTCVKFVERQPEDHVNYIVFTERQCGCCSFVGKRGNGAQAISIGKNCDKFGIVVHELGHVVGFWHEHTRPDRDGHVQIIRDNIMAGQEYNFNKLTEEEVNSLGQGYDYDSIMHYARNTFSKGTYLDTILPIMDRTGRRKEEKRPEIGQRVRLSDSDIAQTNLLYKCHKCGRTLQENSGSFSSPSYNTQSLSVEGEKCEWRITATHGERIILNITDLDIYKSDNCQTDFLEVRDGYWQRSPVLGRFCGAGKAVPAVLSSGPRLLLHYVSTVRPHPHKGFTAYYEAVCGGELELDAGGHLESPNYPDDYQPNKECVWKLTVPTDYQVALKFQSFEVENHDNCVYDFVEVRDGHNADSPLVGVFCGYKTPPDIRSTSNKLLVKFVSDGSVQKAGFSATFMKEYDECALLQHGCQHDCINTLGGYECSCNIGYELHSDGKSCEDACGGTFDDTNGTITSPSFPDLYPAGKSCLWEIIAPPQYRIMLNFTHFDLEGNNVYQQECEYDSLTVHSKLGAGASRRHGVYCGSRIPAPVISEGNALRLMFTSDNSVQKSGFSAIYLTDKDECAESNGGCQHECRNTIGSYVCSCHNGFMLDENKLDCKEGGCKHEVTESQGTINSPNYPDQYPSRKDCVWHFTTTPGHRIKLLFTVFEMEHHQECAYDHIAVYDGDSPDSTTLGRFCGSKIPHPIISNSNQMFMVFKSDASVQRKGFLATHTTACGGRLIATPRVKHLYSHARYGVDNYDSRADCDWTIEAAPGRNVQLTFLTFTLEDEKLCRYDYVEVFNGPDASREPSYGRFCGNSIPAEIISSDSETLLIRFRSDDSVNFKGFSASYYAVDQDPIDSEEMAVSRAVINTHSSRQQNGKWNKPRSSRFHEPFMQRHLKPTDHNAQHQRGHKHLTY